MNKTEWSFIDVLIEENAEAIFVLDRKYKIVVWNKKCEVLFNTCRDKVLNKPIVEVIPDFSDKCFQNFVNAAFSAESAIAKKGFITGSGKDKIYLIPSFSPVTQPAPGPAGCMVILRATEKPVGTSKFEAINNESPVATAIYRPDGTPKYYNQSYLDLWMPDRKMGDLAMQDYNIFEDKQLNESGLLPFFQRAFSGETVEIPHMEYTPYKKGRRERKFIKGHIYAIKDEYGEVEEVVTVLFNITFQKQAEQILIDTHLKFQMLTLGLPGVIYELEEQRDGDVKFVYISQGCKKMFGFSPEEIVEDVTLLDTVIHPGDLEEFKWSEIRSRNENAEWQWEGRIIVNGVEKWIEGKSNPSSQKDGSIIRYGLLLDITDKKKVEEQYRLSEERLKLALQGAELGLWEWDLNNRKTIFNKGWAAKFGYDYHELQLQFQDWGELIHPADLPMVKKKLIKHLKGETPFYEAEYRLRTKSGNYRWILDKGRSMARDEAGKVIKASGTYLDINEKKSAELLIQRNEQLFTQLFESSPLGIVLLNEAHRVMQVNEGFREIFGFTDEEVIGNQLNNFLVPVNYQKEAIEINMRATRGKVSSLESKRLHKNGDFIPVIIYGVPVTLDSKTIGIYGIYVDISDRTRAENELQIRNNELDNFVYKVSHDLRAPLSSILGLVNLAHHKENKDDLLEYMLLIESRVKQLDSFINDVLSHSKNLKLAITVDLINLNEVIEDCFTDLSYLPNADKIKKDIRVANVPFYSDKWRINEIFRNLISNAIKYLNPYIENPFISIDITITDKLAVIQFEDNGIGIEHKILPKVFEMFYRATEQSEGSGIGLYIVKNAIQKLGGQIKLASELGVGTSFTIKIPNRKN